MPNFTFSKTIKFVSGTTVILLVVVCVVLSLETLKTDATRVRGCSASVWVYPTQLDDGRLHFMADSNAAITKGVVALVLAAVQDRPAADVAEADIAALLAPFELARELSSNRTQGIPNMIALVRDTAARLAAI